MTTDERVELAVTAEALVAWERILGQVHGTLEVGPTRDWMEAQIRATRRAGLKAQVQLIAPVVTRPTVLRAATGGNAPDPIDEYKADRERGWTESELRFADGDR